MPAIREFLHLDEETTFGVYNPSTTAAQKAFVMLPDSNATTVRKTPNFKDIMSAGRSGRRVTRTARTYNVGGKIKTRLLASQAALWLDLLINVTTNTNCPDLKSATLTHGFILEGGTCAFNVTRYTGCKFNGTISGDEQGQDIMLDLDVMGSQASAVTDGSFTPPGSTDLFDFEEAFGFQDSAGYITWGTGATGTGTDTNGNPSTTPTVRTLYSSFSLSVGNIFAQYRGETGYMQAIDWKSRNPSLTISNVYRSNQDRLDSEQVIPRATSLALHFGGSTANNGAVLAFNFGPNNYMDTPQDDLQMSGKYVQNLTIQNFIDPTSGVDIQATYTPATS